MKIIPDTNAITALRLGNKTVIDLFEEAETVFLSVIVYAELLYGYSRGSNEVKNKEFLSAFLSKQTVSLLAITDTTSLAYANLRNNLQRIGKPIPTNDLWIASQVIETASILVTKDQHFDHIIGIMKTGF